MKTALICGAVGVFNWIFRKKFLLISLQPEQALKEGMNISLWNFLFYASFGLVITSSVQIAGVLLVFSFLIVPAVCGAMFCDSLGKRLTLGWIMGTVVSVLGCVFSYSFDLPTGAAMVCTFGLVLLMSVGVKLMWLRPKQVDSSHD